MKCCEDSAPVAPAAKPTKQRKGANWGEEETKTFLKLCIEHNIIKLMDGKRHKHIEIFKLVEEKLKDKGFIKTASQLQIKMEHLKELYYNCKKTNNTSGKRRREFLYYEQMYILLNTRPKTFALEEDVTANGVDTSAKEDFVEANVRVLSPEEATALEESGVEIEFSDRLSSKDSNSNQTPSTSSLENRHRQARSQKGGTTSYAKQMNMFAETIMANKTQALHDMLTEHTKAVTTNIAQQLQQQ
ncbi:hypothetical protein FQA39_LY02175 [Lamprigera yunnana]|nr:hypothetical protein FQA39_LY02175 [Lamprigera yunnana]